MEKNNSKKTVRLVLCALFAALIAVGAFIKIPIPYIPLTLQTLFTMLAGLMLGGRLGAISVCVYVAIGLAGLPVFTQGGGITYVLKPTFGYLIGFAVGTYVTGAIANKTAAPTFRRLVGANLAGLAIIYLFGMVYYFLISHLYLGTNISFEEGLASGMIQYIEQDRRCYLVSCCRSNWKAAEPNNKEICSVKTKPLPI